MTLIFRFGSSFLSADWTNGSIDEILYRQSSGMFASPVSYIDLTFFFGGSTVLMIKFTGKSFANIN